MHVLQAQMDNRPGSRGRLSPTAPSLSPELGGAQGSCNTSATQTQ